MIGSISTPTDYFIRVLDIALSSVLLIALAPVFLMITVLIRLADGRPLFFTQTRLGLNRKEFQILKFRTMILGSDLDSYSTKFGDPRVTKLGRRLRSTSLDEIPQLVNVLKGEMSMVGPRPDVISQQALYSQAELIERLSVRPGLTGIAQVRYRSSASFRQRLNSDLEWVRKRSCALYLRTIIQTLPILSKSVN